MLSSPKTILVSIISISLFLQVRHLNKLSCRVTSKMRLALNRGHYLQYLLWNTPPSSLRPMTAFCSIVIVVPEGYTQQQWNALELPRRVNCMHLCHHKPSTLEQIVLLPQVHLSNKLQLNVAFHKCRCISVRFYINQRGSLQSSSTWCKSGGFKQTLQVR
jgi:hypothetical protein